MSFLRRISNAASSFLPSAPSSSGATPGHVPRRATETYTERISEGDDDDISYKDSIEAPSRASWELSDSGSIRSSGASTSSRASFEDSDDGSESEDEEKPRDRYDMMVRHLWHTAERSGWFRDAAFDGLVSLRCVLLASLYFQARADGTESRRDTSGPTHSLDQVIGDPKTSNEESKNGIPLSEHSTPKSL
jgi:hypothetical protein